MYAKQFAFYFAFTIQKIFNGWNSFTNKACVNISKKKIITNLLKKLEKKLLFRYQDNDIP